MIGRTHLTPTVMLMGNGPIQRVVNLAVEAERAGFGRCWIYDEGLHTRDVWVTLAAIACKTDRIALGPGITNPYTRHPGVTAMAAASLAELSDGRAFLGLGVGGGLTLGPLGISRTAPATTVRDMITALRGLWRGATVDLESAVFSFNKARMNMDQRPIDIWLAGRGPRMMELGGRAADGFHMSFLSKRTLGDSIGKVRAAAGRPIPISYSTMIVTEDADLPEARRQLSFRLPDQPADVHAALGIDPAAISEIRAALTEGGPAMAAGLVRDEWLGEFVLDASTARSELEDLATKHGITEFAVPVLNLDQATKTMQAAARLVD